jgi:hypothetical protein
MERWWNDTDKTKPNFSEKNLPQCHFVETINPTWTGPRSNPVLHGKRPRINRLSHGTDRRAVIELQTVEG